MPLPLGCSDAQFAEHVGSGVAMYLHFVKMTGWMFAVASLIALPQFAENALGLELSLRWPLADDCGYNQLGVFGLVNRVLAIVGYFFYATLLGNISFASEVDSTRGPHLASALLLSMMFCVYVYWIWWHNNQVLSTIEADSTRASDFAVLVSKLPARGSDPRALREHFRFFGAVNSVVVVNEQHTLIALLERQQALRARWRQLHLEYRRAVRAARSSHLKGRSNGKGEERTSSYSRSGERLLDQMEVVWRDRLCAREELRRATAAPTACVGHAVIIFERMADAARCVRHYELIRAHERSLDIDSMASLDFRQLYYRANGVEYKLEAVRAPEPSDILWGNLASSRLSVRTQNVKTTLIVFLIACVSTYAITLTSIQATLYSKGLLTTLWSTPVIILANVAIFFSVPQLSMSMERHHTLSSQHTHMLMKMVFFQLFNTVVASLSFMFRHWDMPKPAAIACPLLQPPIAPHHACFDPSYTLSYKVDLEDACVRHWYITGAVVLINTVIGDLTAILGLVEFIRPDKLLVRYLIAPRSATQAEMNQVYALDSDFYLPFRYQLTLKIVCLTFTFCSAMPLLLPLGALFMLASYYIDRYNLLRVFKPPPRTTDRTVAMSVLFILPVAVFAHLLFAVFFYSKQADLPVPAAYYGGLVLLGLFVMMRISATLTSQSQRASKEAATHITTGMGREMAMLDPGRRGSGGAAAEELDLAANGGGSGNGLLRSHLDSLELYVPPLSALLLKEVYATTAAHSYGHARESGGPNGGKEPASHDTSPLFVHTP